MVPIHAMFRRSLATGQVCISSPAFMRCTASAPLHGYNTIVWVQHILLAGRSLKKLVTCHTAQMMQEDPIFHILLKFLSQWYKAAYQQLACCSILDLHAEEPIQHTRLTSVDAKDCAHLWPGIINIAAAPHCSADDPIRALHERQGLAEVGMHTLCKHHLNDQVSNLTVFTSGMQDRKKPPAWSYISSQDCSRSQGR